MSRITQGGRNYWSAYPRTPAQRANHSRPGFADERKAIVSALLNMSERTAAALIVIIAVVGFIAIWSIP